MKHGDFTNLAENYSKYRPGYAPIVLDGIEGLLGKPLSEADAADVGAGTGIWSRILFERGLRSLTAVEPNDAMRERGESDSAATSIVWRAGSGESTGLADASVDLLTMASCFHWMDFETTTAEISRALRPKGCFVALWNPRLLAANPLTVEIEDKLYAMAPHIERVSSGRSSFCASLSDKLRASPHFEDVLYLEAEHVAEQSREHYLGVWGSVNDVRVQAGEETFSQFMSWLGERLEDVPSLEVTYSTRAWVARRGD
jgi:SAM-dependent methyltransferase